MTRPDEGSARNRDLYMTTPNVRKRQTCMPQRDLDPWSQQRSGGRSTP